MQPVSASLVLEHPLHNDFIPHAPPKKKAAAAIVSGTYLIVHNVKPTRSKVQESAKTRKTQTHTHTHTREPRVYFYNASKNTTSLHPTPNEEEQKDQKTQKNSRCINARCVTALLDPINNATIARATKQKKKQNRTNKQMQQDESRNAAMSESRQQRCTTTYYCRFNTAFLGPKNKSTNQAIKQEKVRPAKCFETSSSSSPHGKQANDTPHSSPTPKQNKKQNKKLSRANKKIADKQKENGQNEKKKL
jgi:hypothetical protein